MDSSSSSSSPVSVAVEIEVECEEGREANLRLERRRDLEEHSEGYLDERGSFLDWFCLRESREKASAMLTAAIDTREDASSSLSLKWIK